MSIIEHLPSWLPGSSFPPLTQTKNWRLLVFSAVFVLFAAAGLIYNYTRAAEYRAGARVEIIPAEKIPGEPNTGVVLNSGPDGPFLTEVQLLTARAALTELAARIPRAGFAELMTGADPVLELQRMISVNPVAGTQVVQLWAAGGKPELLPFVLNELINIYQTQLGERFVDTSTDALAQARDETNKYKTAILKLRGELESFRTRYGIVSKERDENEPTARAKGLNAAINVAEEKAIAGQSKLNSIRAAIAAGKAVTRAKDNPTLAAMEQRLSQAREEWKQLERRYTAAYLAREREATALKTKIPELEEQIRREREASQQANLAEAEQEAAQTQEALANLKRQLSGEKSNVQSFSTRLTEHNALQTQLEGLEKLYDGAAERLVKIEAREGARRPKLRVIQSASVPSEPWRPNYHRDAAIVIAGSLILGWLAAWLADFLLRRESGPTVIVAPTPMPYPISVTELTHHSAPALGPAPVTAQLPAPGNLPRELESVELAVMFDSADLEAQIAMAALLCGLSPEELVALTWNALDGQTNIIKIAGPAPRSIQIAPEVSGLFTAMRQQRNAQSVDRLLGEPGADALPLSHLEALISYTAHDAALQQPAEATPWALRHTFICHLVRQGIRFSDLARIVGTLPADVTAAYGAISPLGSRRSIDETDRVIPALREFAKKFETQPPQAHS